jgi:DNA invertase Pin-like site-specific DNA recombinase
MMRLAAYLRVSTDAQTEGLGLDVQEAGIRAWAANNGHSVTDVFTDAGVSGANGVEGRVALLDALNALESDADGLVVYRLDRLARSLTVQEGTLRKVWDLGASMFTVDLGEIPEDDPNDPMRTALRQMVGVFAQLERGMITARMRAGRAKKASNGGYAYGAPPYGFRSSDGALVPDPSEQATLTRIRQLRTAGKSYEQIAQALNTDGVSPRRGRAWHRAVIARIA